MIIKEFLPNPVGSDQESEYIKLLNDGQTAVLLNGWVLKDASGKTYQLSGSVPAGQELVLPYSQTKIVLNNNGEEILLYNAAGELVDRLNYSGQAKEGQIIAKSQALVMPEPVAGVAGNPASDFLNQNAGAGEFGNTIFICVLTAVILAGLGLYIVKQLEKKLNIKLF